MTAANGRGLRARVARITIRVAAFTVAMGAIAGAYVGGARGAIIVAAAMIVVMAICGMASYAIARRLSERGR